jgi:hypothetical protein
VSESAVGSVPIGSGVGLNTHVYPYLWSPIQVEEWPVAATTNIRTQVDDNQGQSSNLPVAGLSALPARSTPILPTTPRVTHRHLCPHRHCSKGYLHKGDLTRHITGIHKKPSSFLCHLHRCPRGIPDKGFSRKDKLVDHLKSRKHGLSAKDAVYEAALHNLSHH